MLPSQDFTSLYQVPRSPEQLAIFKKALPPMNQTYASAVGTTVLQITEIPDRPSDFDGVLCLFDLAESVDEAADLLATTYPYHKPIPVCAKKEGSPVENGWEKSSKK